MYLCVLTLHPPTLTLQRNISFCCHFFFKWDFFTPTPAALGSLYINQSLLTKQKYILRLCLMTCSHSNAACQPIRTPGRPAAGCSLNNKSVGTFSLALCSGVLPLLINTVQSITWLLLVFSHESHFKACHLLLLTMMLADLPRSGFRLWGMVTVVKQKGQDAAEEHLCYQMITAIDH